MFERYAESAKRALFFARYEVSELGASQIEPEHVLLGLTRQVPRLVARVMALPEVSVEILRAEIACAPVVRDRLAGSVEIPFSAATQRLLLFTAEEADRLGCSSIKAEHLLLGLLKEESSVAWAILTSRGLRVDEARNAIVTTLADPLT